MSLQLGGGGVNGEGGGLINSPEYQNAIGVTISSIH